MTPDQFPAYHYRADLVRVVDGDTAVLRFQLGFNVAVEMPVRLVGYNAPETHGPNPDRARQAADALGKMLAAPLYVETLKDSQSFARYLGRVRVLSDAGVLIDVADVMKAAGFEVPQGQ